jgi:uncharacterized protein
MGSRKILLALAFASGPVTVNSAIALQPDVPALARQLIPNYREPKRETYLDNLMRAYLVAGQYSLALTMGDSLRELRAKEPNTFPPVANFPYEVYALAKTGVSIDSAFAARARLVDDRASANALRYVLGTSLIAIRIRHDTAIARATGRSDLPQAEIVDLVRRRAALLAFGMLEPVTMRLLEADDARRYIIMRDILVPTAEGGKICALVFLPRGAKDKLTTLLNFTVYDSDQITIEARRTASNGYAGVEGLTRGKGCSPDQPVSHEYDGIDAAALIDWIARQPWSDGRVGMYGGSYEGMTQWGSAKHMPKALKAMMPSVTHAPGIDFPMSGNIFATYAYPWPFYTTHRKRGLDSATYNDSERWTRLQQKWYASGSSYRSLPEIDGKPNPTFQRWLNHSTYDAYWKRMVASDDDFRRIDIPILTTTGYFDGGETGALWFFRQHTTYLRTAQHYLVVGPYDHVTGQRGNLDPMGRQWQTNIQGIDVDSAASIDLGELRYLWFDYVFKGKSKPSLLTGKVNYFVMNANVWKHAPTIETMSDSSVAVMLARTLTQRVDLADRSDVNAWGPGGNLLDPSSSARTLVDTIPNIANAFTFTSSAFNEAMEVSGLFSGTLELEVNKKDFDFTVTLFELTREGKYIQLSYHSQRASFARSPSKRELLSPGTRTRLPVSSSRLISRRLAAGSRIAVVIAVPKKPSQQINYGTGKDVSDETISDARTPLTITWYPGTVVHVPIKTTSR